MSTIVTRSGKGSPLTHVEVDANFTNLNSDKYQEGSAIGAVTPAAGTFTTLTATGQANLGGSSTAPSFRATVGDNAPNTMWVEAKGASSSDSAVYLGVGGTPSKPLIFANSANYFSFRTTTIGGIANEQLRITHSLNSVNYVQVTGAATGSAATISAQGSDSNIFLQFYSKGSNGFNFYSGNGTGRQLRIDGGVTSSVNFLGVQGATTSQVPILSASAQSSDTNVGLAIQSKGTGAIDLAAGSSGVNISNGGTVTAITRTAAGTFYTSIPTLTVSPPTTAGGVQATATPQMAGQTVTVQAAGTGYVVGNTLTVVGGTSSATAQLRVDAINGSGGVTATSFVNSAGAYSVLPTNPVSVTGGAGSGATFNITQWFFASVGPIITNAGSGYVEQPTVSFSGGGGSGAAAYAYVGTTPKIQSVFSSLAMQTPSANMVFQVQDDTSIGASASTLYAIGASSSLGRVAFRSSKALYIGSGSSNPLGFYTNTSQTAEGSQQFAVTHTASAVNYVQVTGGSTGNGAIVSAQGSDTNVGFRTYSKGSGSISFWTAGGSSRQFQVSHASGTVVNYATATGSITGAAPAFGVEGTDTNIDLTLTPKGTGATVANGDFKMNSGYGSAAVAYGCRAWVNFNGTGTVAIRASGNVSSITDNGTGDYTVNFTTAMPDANYCYELSGQRIANASNYNAVVSSAYTLSTTALRVNTSNDVSNTLEDFSAVCVAIFR